MCTNRETMTILRKVYERSRELFGKNLVKCYLYGSYARGDYDDESDVDILLIVDCSDDDIRAYNKPLAKIDSYVSLEHNVTVSITAKPLKQFNCYAEVSPFYRNVINEGIPYTES